MKNNKNAFTMIELVFVIVVLGILAAIAVPKFAATRNDAIIAKGKADIATIRSAIVTERQSRLIRGDPTWIPTLSGIGGNLFRGDDANRTLLMYGIAPGEWTHGVYADPIDPYAFTVGGVDTNFTYNSDTGIFTCTAGADNCDNLVN